MKIENEIERDAPLTNIEKAALGLFALWPILAILAIGALCNGCAYKGGKVVDEKQEWGRSFRKWLDWIVKLLIIGCGTAMGVTAWKLILGD